MRKKRNLFDELVEGFDALADQRVGKRALRTHVVNAPRTVKAERAMLTLRCTQRVRKRLRLPEQLPEARASSGALGDWYVHLVRFGHSEFAIVTSERCLLTMLLPARELRASLVPNLHASLRGLLERLGVPQERIDLELAAMHPVSFARATNRRVLGSMNDFAFQARHYLARGDDLITVADRLADTPMSAIGEGAGHLGFPAMLARALLAGGVA